MKAKLVKSAVILDLKLSEFNLLTGALKIAKKLTGKKLSKKAFKAAADIELSKLAKKLGKITKRK